MKVASYRADLAMAVLIAAVSLHYHWAYSYPGGPNSRDAGPREFNWDEGTVIDDAYRISQGEVMYRDFFEFQGPVFYYFNAAIFTVAGPSMRAAQIGQIAINALGAILLALAISRLAGRLAGLAAAGVYVFLLVPMWPFAYPHWTALMFVHGALLLLLVERHRTLALIGAGACLALSAATIQSLGLPALAAAGAGMFLAEASTRNVRQGLLSGLLVATGAAGVFLLIGSYFLFRGALGDLYWSMFVWPFRHYRGINATEYAAWLSEHIANNGGLPEPWREISQKGLTFITWLPKLALAGGATTLLLGGALALWKKQRAPHLAAAFVAAMAVLPLWTSGTRRDVTHLAFLATFGLVGACAVLAWTAHRFAVTRHAVGAVLLAGACVLGANFDHKLNRTRGMLTPDFQVLFMSQSGAAKTILERTTPDDRILLGFGGGFHYFFLGRKNATSYGYLPFDWRANSDYFADAQWDRVAAEILERKPKLIYVDHVQWARILKSAPAIGAAYRQEGGFFFRQ